MQSLWLRFDSNCLICILLITKITSKESKLVFVQQDREETGLSLDIVLIKLVGVSWLTPIAFLMLMRWARTTQDCIGKCCWKTKVVLFVSFLGACFTIMILLKHVNYESYNFQHFLSKKRWTQSFSNRHLFEIHITFCLQRS